MSNTNGYNGWSNYETWVINLWLTNDSEGCDRLQSMARDCLTHLGNTSDAIWELAKRIEEDHDECNPAGTIDGPFADLLNHALGMVDWREIAAAAIEEEAQNM